MDTGLATIPCTQQTCSREPTLHRFHRISGTYPRWHARKCHTRLGSVSAVLHRTARSRRRSQFLAPELYTSHDLNRLNKWQHLEAAKKKLRSTAESKGFERTTERTCLKPLLCTALHSARARKTNRAPEKELHARLLSRRPAFAKTR